MAKKKAAPVRKFDALRDSLDFRDRIYQPALIKLDSKLYPEWGHIEILDQGQEGACPGFGLAAVINYLNRKRGVKNERVSTRMLYEMAKRHDRWPGEDYPGSSARGAMKGWSKNGVCPEGDWPYDPNKPGYLTVKAQMSAMKYPLGAYYRVLKRRSDLHAAINETGVVFATAATHEGWSSTKGKILFDPKKPKQGGHAFAIIGYNEKGFIIQNSWGEDWGAFKAGEKTVKGVSLWTYEDYEENFWDGWVARMALPVKPGHRTQTSRFSEGPGGMEVVEAAPRRAEIRDHYIHIDDGQFDPRGNFPSYREEVRDIIDRALGGDAKHLLLYAHGGLNPVNGSAARVGMWRDVFKANGVHEIHFIWETGMIAEMRDIILGKETFAKKRAGGFGDWWDRMIEKAAHKLGYALWKEMRSDAEVAFDDGMDGTETLGMIIEKYNAMPANKRPKIHLAGHSAGSIWMGHLLSRWGELGGPKIKNLTLFAPACTHDFYKSRIEPAWGSTFDKFNNLILDKKKELDDNVAVIYRKSLLYLVSRSLQEKGKVVPILGMEKHLKSLSKKTQSNTFNTRDNTGKTASESHGDFDNDVTSMNTLLALVLGKKPKRPFKEEDLN